MVEKLEKLFESHKLRKYGYASDIYTAEALEKYHSCRCVLYYTGNAMRAVVDYVTKTDGIKLDCIIDENPKTEEFNGIRVLSRSAFAELNKNGGARYYALIYGTAMNTAKRVKIFQYLRSQRIVKVIWLNPEVDAITKPDWYDFFISNQDAFCKNVELFADERSKDTYFEYLRAYLEGHRYGGYTSPEEDKYFLTEEKLVEHLEDECWINLGACRGDTIFHFIRKGLPFQKIYAVEGDGKTARKLERHLRYLSPGLRKKIQTIGRYFGAGGIGGGCSIDDYFLNKKITYINMDIEGAEADVLKSAEAVIRKNRPVLAVCVYHKKEDLLVIPELISKLTTDYTFFLRKYPSIMGSYLDGYFELNELVLYAVPSERLKGQKGVS